MVRVAFAVFEVTRVLPPKEDDWKALLIGKALPDVQGRAAVPASMQIKPEGGRVPGVGAVLELEAVYLNVRVSGDGDEVRFFNVLDVPQSSRVRMRGDGPWFDLSGNGVEEEE